MKKCMRIIRLFGRGRMSKMKYPNRIFISLILTLMLPMLAYSSPERSITHEEIFHWVATELKSKKDYPMPEIRIVSREELQRTFRKASDKSLKRWAGIYGKNEANKIMSQYLEEIIGLFEAKTKLIYVGSFLEACKQESIIAHELTHYIQVVENGEASPSNYRADNLRFFRELEASKVEKKFMKTFCTSPNRSQSILPFPVAHAQSSQRGKVATKFESRSQKFEANSKSRNLNDKNELTQPLDENIDGI